MKINEEIKKLFICVGLIVIAWVAYLTLVCNYEIDSYSALIMVWISAGILLLAFFPELMDNIEKIKIKDILEIGFKKETEKFNINSFFNVGNIKDFTSLEKEGFSSLQNVLKKIRNNVRDKNKPIIISVNLFRNDYISIPMLFIYLYFLSLFDNPVYVLFIKSSRVNIKINSIKKEEIIGVIEGSIIITFLLRMFPTFSNIYTHRIKNNYSISLFDDNIDFDNIYNRIFERESNNSEYLTIEKVVNWFSDELSTNILEYSSGKLFYEAFELSIENKDKFMIMLKDNKLFYIVELCSFSNKIIYKILLRNDRNE